jgi:hypothetical protein
MNVAAGSDALGDSSPGERRTRRNDRICSLNRQPTHDRQLILTWTGSSAACTPGSGDGSTPTGWLWYSAANADINKAMYRCINRLSIQ